MTSQVYSEAGTGLWLCPAGVYSVRAQCWGGGGGGQAAPAAVASGSGGGGGEYAEDASVAVTPGRTYPWTVGNGGFSRGASSGGPSSFSGDALEVLAHGGQGGSGTSAGGTGSVNSVRFDGGKGGAGASGLLSDAGAGGGSSGGTGSAGGDGGNGAAFTPGAGGTAAGAGPGGSGGVAGSAGSAGSSPGGGGGGAGQGAAIGGRGAPGQVILTWTAPAQPVIPVFPAGYPALPADFDGWIQSPASFFTSGKPVFRAFLSGGATIPAGLNLLAFDHITEDPYNGWIGGTVSAWQAPAGYSGIYVVTLAVAVAAVASVVAARVGVNSAAQLYAVSKAWIPGAAPPGMASGVMPVTLTGGLDSVQGFAYLQASAGVLSSSTGQQCNMSISWFSQ